MCKIIIIFALIILLCKITFCDETKYAVIISANMEWKAVKKIFPKEKYQKSIWGEYPNPPSKDGENSLRVTSPTTST
jgi:hypothetical protein